MKPVEEEKKEEAAETAESAETNDDTNAEEDTDEKEPKDNRSIIYYVTDKNQQGQYIRMFKEQGGRNATATAARNNLPPH